MENKDKITVIISGILLFVVSLLSIIFTSSMELILLLNILWGFITTIISKEKKSRIGFYVGLTYSVIFLAMVILGGFYARTIDYIGILIVPGLLGSIGGFIAEKFGISHNNAIK